MKYVILISMLLLSILLYYFVVSHKDVQQNKIDKTPPKKMTVREKKERFKKLLIPAVQTVYAKLMKRYKKIATDMNEGKNQKEIEKLKLQYNVLNDEDLLACLKPHPVSIVLAQAAMESSWATSRFFVKANNIFGMWSVNPKEPRIAAGEKRDGKRTIWLRKFSSIDDAIRAYYQLMAKGKAFKEFRTLRLKYDDPYKITPGLDKYSEIGQVYINEINQVIKYNKFTVYDK